MSESDSTVEWLLQGDPSVRWQVHADLLDSDEATVLDYLGSENIPKDERMKDAIDLIISKRKKDGTWLLPRPHPGKTFFTLEETGKPSRMNTLRGLRILKWWET